MKNNHTDITIVLDRSGSMDSVKEDTIGGFNTFLNEQKSAPGTATISLHQFDDRFETVIDAKDIKSAEPLTEKTFVPRGSTALYDAVGKAMKITGERLKNLAESDRAEKVVFVIITDGHENASKEYSHEKIKEMIEHQKSVYKWEIVFLGAEMDAQSIASDIGITVDNAMSNAGNSIGTQAMYASVSANLRAVRSGRKKDMSWTANDKEAQIKAGLNPNLNK